MIGTRDPTKPFQVPVIVEFDGETIMRKGISGRFDAEVIEKLVDRGLRGQLKLESFVTGVLYVDLGMRPGTPAELQGGANVPYPEIPTEPTALEEVQQKAAAFLSKLNEADIEGLVGDLKTTVRHIDEVEARALLEKTDGRLGRANRPDEPRLIRRIRPTSPEVRRDF